VTVEEMRDKVLLYEKNKWVQIRYPEEGIPLGMSLTFENGKRVYRWNDIRSGMTKLEIVQ